MEIKQWISLRAENIKRRLTETYRRASIQPHRSPEFHRSKNASLASTCRAGHKSPRITRNTFAFRCHDKATTVVHPHTLRRHFIREVISLELGKCWSGSHGLTLKLNYPLEKRCQTTSDRRISWIRQLEFVRRPSVYRSPQHWVNSFGLFLISPEQRRRINFPLSETTRRNKTEMSFKSFPP